MGEFVSAIFTNIILFGNFIHSGSIGALDKLAKRKQISILCVQIVVTLLTFSFMNIHARLHSL